jgi:hypothetical protein
MNPRARAIALAATAALALPSAASAEYDNRPKWRKTLDRMVDGECEQRGLNRCERGSRRETRRERGVRLREEGRREQTRRNHSDEHIPWRVPGADDGEIACTIYRVAYVLRHGANKPSGLQLRRGCDLWAGDWHYHTRRR